METGPPKLIETLVGRLIPSASREHVLGDLREQSSSTTQFVANAVRTVPFVVVSQLVRTFDGLLTGWQAFILFLVFRLPRFDGNVAEAVRLLGPLCCALIALAIRDAYRDTGRAPAVSIDLAFEDALRDALGAAACAGITATAPFWIARLAGIEAQWLPTSSKLLGSALGGFLLLLPLRVAWSVLFSAGGYRRLVPNEIGFDHVEADEWRRTLERRRDTLRASWLWFPPLAILVAFASLMRYSGRPLPVLVEGATTLAALMLLKGMANRLADLVQRDIDALTK